MDVKLRALPQPDSATVARPFFLFLGMQKPIRAALLGATGLIGRHLLHALQAEPLVETINVLVRRPIDQAHPRTAIKLVNFADAESVRLALEGASHIFCAVGTTQKKVQGDEAAYRKVDYEIPVQAARWGKANGCRHFLLVSSVGADPGSNNFYLRTKGETEKAIAMSGIETISFFRPSLLLGHRPESRPGERLGQLLLPLVSPLLAGKAARYKPIRGADVASAMVRRALQPVEGTEIFHYREIMTLLKS